MIYVTGHRNPDTDSIAIGYAELKRRRPSASRDSRRLALPPLGRRALTGGGEGVGSREGHRVEAHEPVFGEWSGDDWDNWRERIFQPAAIAVGLPDDTIPRDLRRSFASLLIFEGRNALEVAPELGYKPSTCLDIYGRLFEEFDPARRRPAAEVIREARKAVREGTVRTGYPARSTRDAETGRATAEDG